MWKGELLRESYSDGFVNRFLEGVISITAIHLGVWLMRAIMTMITSGLRRPYESQDKRFSLGDWVGVFDEVLPMLLSTEDNRIYICEASSHRKLSDLEALLRFPG